MSKHEVQNIRSFPRSLIKFAKFHLLLLGDTLVNTQVISHENNDAGIYTDISLP